MFVSGISFVPLEFSQSSMFCVIVPVNERLRATAANSPRRPFALAHPVSAESSHPPAAGTRCH